MTIISLHREENFLKVSLSSLGEENLSVNTRCTSRSLMPCAALTIVTAKPIWVRLSSWQAACQAAGLCVRTMGAHLKMGATGLGTTPLRTRPHARSVVPEHYIDRLDPLMGLSVFNFSYHIQVTITVQLQPLYLQAKPLALIPEKAQVRT